MQLVSYLNFNGQCKEAFQHYAQVLGGDIVAMHSFAEMPQGEACFSAVGDLIMHARLVTDSGVLMGSDCPPDTYEAPKGLWVSVHPKSPEEAERVFAALAEGGSVTMPIQQTFWATRFGMVTDRFGTPWMVNCESAG